jgi:hypothetical protein
MQYAFVAWTCVCGIKVKAGLDMTNAGVPIRCPNPSCKTTRTLPGQIAQLSVEAEQGAWRSVDVNSLIDPPQESG